MDGKLVTNNFGTPLGAQGIITPKPVPQIAPPQQGPPPMNPPQQPAPIQGPPPMPPQIPQGPPPIVPGTEIHYADPVNLIFGNYPQKQSIQDTLKGSVCLTKLTGLS